MPITSLTQIQLEIKLKYHCDQQYTSSLMVYKLSLNQMQWMDGLCWESHMYVRTTITIVARLIIKLPIPSFRSDVYNAKLKSTKVQTLGIW